MLGLEFLSRAPNMAPTAALVAQLDRAPDYGSGGHALRYGVTLAQMVPGDRNVVGGHAACLAIQPKGGALVLKKGALCASFHESRWSTEVPPTQVLGAASVLRSAWQSASARERMQAAGGWMVTAPAGRALSVALETMEPAALAATQRIASVADAPAYTAAADAALAALAEKGIFTRGFYLDGLSGGVTGEAVVTPASPSVSVRKRVLAPEALGGGVV